MVTTIKDIAQKAGISAASVSRILTNRGRFSDETAKRVKEIAQSMGYYKNQSAADLSQKESRVIGVLVPDTHTNFADEIIKGMQQVSHQLNYELLVMFINNDEEKQLQTIKSLLSRNVSALFMLAIDTNERLLQFIHSTNVKLVNISNPSRDNSPSISSDNQAMIELAVDYLYQNGHQYIGLIGASASDAVVAKIRRKSFKEALEKRGLLYQPEFVWGMTNEYQTGLNVIKHFGYPLPFTAAISSADIISVGILNGLSDANLKIPKDLSIVSIDGTELIKFTRPQITAIKQDFQKMGQLSLELLDAQKLTSGGIFHTKIELIAGDTVRKLSF